MKNLKTVIKRASSPKTAQSNAAALQTLPSQRGKATSRDIFKKYNQNTPIDLSKQSIIPNKYRIVTEPIDDHMLQLSKSYARLSRSKGKQVKFDSQHNSIKSRQKTLSKEKYAHSICPNCHSYETELQMLREEVSRMVNLKEKWKCGQIVLEDFILDSDKYRARDFAREALGESFQEMRNSLIDLMRDIEVLTEVDYPKLLTHGAFSNQESFFASEQESELKVLLQQLREQSEGRLTPWDLEIETGHQSFKTIVRNLKTNLMQAIRENLELKTYHFLPRKDGSVLEEDIRKVVFEILRGLSK